MKLNMNLNFKLFLILKLIELSAAIILNCSEDYKNLGTNGILSCVVDKNFTVLNDDEELSGICGIKSNVTIIRGFVAENKEIHYIPQNISANLPELKNFMIKNSSLKEVTSKNLREFPELIYLDLSYNHIKVLDKDVFQHNHQLNDIQLNNNHIFAIESDAFDMPNRNGISLNSLNLYGNNCQFQPAKSRQNVREAIKNMKERCWNETSIKLFEAYKVESRFEKLEIRIINQKQNLMRSNDNLQDQIISIKSFQEKNSIILESLQNLNDTVNERIKRSAEEINKTVNQSFIEFQHNFKDIISSQSVILNDILTQVNDISSKEDGVNNLNMKLDEMKQMLCSDINSYNAKKIATYYCATNDSSLNLLSIPTEYLNTILLIIIIVFQLISCCSKSRPKPKINKFKSRFHTAPPSLEPVYYTTATQIIDDYPKESQRLQKYYESYDDIQSYDYMSTSEKKNDSNEVITTVQAEVEHQGFSNEIYGSVTASNEDLYSEVISPMRMEGKGELNDESAIYAVVEKRKDGD